MTDVQKMETKVIPTLLKILARDREELLETSSDPVWHRKHMNYLLDNDFAMPDFMANVFEKDGTYPEFKGQSVSEILDTFLLSWFEGCFQEEEDSAEQLFTHGY